MESSGSIEAQHTSFQVAYMERHIQRSPRPWFVRQSRWTARTRASYPPRMVWVVLGLRRATERVPGGARVTRRCEGCGEETTFYEKTIRSTFRLYFLDVFDYQRDRVMACGKPMSEAADHVGAKLGDAASRLGGTRRVYPRRALPSREPDLTPDEEEALRELDGPDDLERRFRELERSAKSGADRG